MRKTVVRAGETAQALALRAGLPLCMILRANGLFSAAWLLPGREIVLPEAGCREDEAFPCPARAARLPAVARRLYLRRTDETRADAARALGVPLRLIPPHRRAFDVPAVDEEWEARTAGLSTMLDAEERAVNGLFGVIYPGTELLQKKR